MYIAGILAIILLIAAAASRSRDNQDAVLSLGLLGGVFLALLLFTTRNFLLTAVLGVVGSFVFAMLTSPRQS